MGTFSAIQLYEKYYTGDKARYGIFDALFTWQLWNRVLYPGSFIHVTASFVFPSVTYVDNDKNAKRFFAHREEVLSFVKKNKVYKETPELKFHASNYERPFSESPNSFDLLLSLYAGFISKPCKTYLKKGGILAVNNSHGDAGLASIDPDYTFVGVIQGQGGSFRVVTDNLDTYFCPKKAIDVTEELLRNTQRGIGYTKTAPVYLFKKIK